MPPGTYDIPLYRVLAFDDDVGPNADIDYSIKTGRGNGRFKINPKTGVITSQKDFESGMQYDLTVRLFVCNKSERNRICSIWKILLLCNYFHDSDIFNIQLGYSPDVITTTVFNLEYNVVLDKSCRQWTTTAEGDMSCSLHRRGTSVTVTHPTALYGRCQTSDGNGEWSGRSHGGFGDGRRCWWRQNLVLHYWYVYTAMFNMNDDIKVKHCRLEGSCGNWILFCRSNLLRVHVWKVKTHCAVEENEA